MRAWRSVTAVAGAMTLAASAYAAVPATAATTVPTIHPGVQTMTNGAQCTANFVYTDGSTTYLGQAAHCSGTGGNTATDGCTSGSLPLGTKVDVLADDGTTVTGTMVYNSWLAMQKVGANDANDANACAYNDLALIAIPSADAAKVSPTVPFFGGPTGLATTGTQQGDMVYSYGNSELRLGLTQLSPKEGISLGDSAGGWTHQVYTMTPGIPGDSGSGFLTADGKALGVLSTVEVAPVPGSNNVGDLSHELTWLNGHLGQLQGSNGSPVHLVTSSTPFTPGILGVGGL